MVQLVDSVRISLGTAMVLGLENGTPPEHFTTAFVMTHNEDGCTANCAFCPQASTSNSNPKLLSRIGWPKFLLEDVIENLKKNTSLERVCIQALNYEQVVSDVESITEAIRKFSNSPISVCIHPLDTHDLQRLKQIGINNIGIAFDACTQSLFDDIKGEKRNGPYTWSGHLNAIKDAQSIFGIGNVTTHLIVGLGETEREAAEFLFEMKKMGVRVGLFAFTNIQGTSMENIPQPNLGAYRRIQILRELLTRNKISEQQISFDDQERIEFRIDRSEVRESLSSGSAFRVTGCPGCNRPYYNERPRGPMYNYPRPLTEKEVDDALAEAGMVN